MLDVLIIGGGPAGVGAAIYAKRAGLSVEIYEYNIYAVGQLTEIDQVDNYLGLGKVGGWELAESFGRHAKEMGIEAKEGTVTGVHPVFRHRKEKIRESARGVLEDTSENALKTLEDTSENTLKTLEDTSENTLKTLEDTSENTLKTLEDTSENTLKTLEDTSENALKTLEDASENALKAAGDSLENVPESGEDEPEKYWCTEFEEGFTVCSKTVIYAAGAKRRKLGIPGEAEYAGRGVSYCATCDGTFFRGEPVAVVGGGNAALDDALYLTGLCPTVYLIHRRNEFRGFRSTVDLVCENEKIKILTPRQAVAITGEKKVTALTLDDGTELAVKGVFIAVGMQPCTEVLKACDSVKLDATGYVVADESGVTSAPGFFVAGDVRTKPLRQIITAVADGANAAMSAAAYIQGR